MSKNTSLAILQNNFNNIAQKFGFSWTAYVQYIHLVEELGELGEALTVHQGDRKSGTGDAALADHDNIQEEFGDVLFTLIQLANKLDIDLEDVAEKTVLRYEEKHNTLHKNSILTAQDKTS